MGRSVRLESHDFRADKRRRYIHAVDPDLLKLLGIDDGDLVANRTGQMGVHQQAAQRVQVRRLSIGTWGGAAVFGLLTLLLVVQDGPWPVPLGTGVMWVITFFLLERTAQRQTNDAVRALNGPVRVRRTETLEGPNSSVPHITLWADIAGTSCLLPTAVSFDAARWQTAIGPGSVRVYVHGGAKIPRVVGIEPAPA